MTTGTKIFLAVFAALIGVMVLYYGLMLPEPQLPPALSVAAHQAPNVASETPPLIVEQTPARVEPELAPVLESPAYDPPPFLGILSQSVHSTTNADGVTPIAPPTLFLPEAEVEATPEDVSPPATNPTPVVEQPRPSQPLANQPVNLGNAVPPQSTEYTIQAGDTMSSIAEDWFGEPNKWSLIAKENPRIDPNRLVIGQKIRLPSKDAKPAAVKDQTSPTDSLFTVRSGDTLAKIAREYYSDVSKWKAIYDANRSVIGSDPANLKPGMKLKLPPPSKPAAN